MTKEDFLRKEESKKKKKRGFLRVILLSHLFSVNSITIFYGYADTEQ